MSFLAPIAPALPFVGPAFSAIGSLFGGGQSGQQQQATELLRKLTGQLQGTAAEFSPFANKFLTQAGQGFGSAMNFWAPLLSGSRTAASSVLAPDISRVNEQFQGILDATRGARTGAGASIYAAAPYQQQAQIQSIYQGLRPQAAQAMGQLGGQMGQLGQGTLQTVLAALGQALGGGQGLLGQANIGYGQSRAAGSVFGSALNEIMKNLGNLSIFQPKPKVSE